MSLVSTHTVHTMPDVDKTTADIIDCDLRVIKVCEAQSCAI